MIFLLRSPVVVLRGVPPCRCGMGRDDWPHATAEECAAAPGGCQAPQDHHPYRPQPRFRRYQPDRDWSLEAYR